MGAQKMTRQKTSGTSLIELLVVIVVFLVGILAFVQIFPQGLNTLRVTRNNTLANSLARSEMQRIQGQSNQVAELIAPVTYVGGTTAFISINTSANFNDLLPPVDDTATNTGRLTSDGQVLIGGTPSGPWQKLSGSNVFSRIIGEGRPVPAPRRVGTDQGGLMQLMFAPIYYFRDAATGVQPVNRAALLVYGNDMVGRNAGPPGNPNDPRTNDSLFIYVDGEDAEDPPFADQDQIWIGSLRDGSGTVIPKSYRIQFSFNYDEGGTVRQYDVIVVVDPSDTTIATQVGNYFVVSLQQLVGKSGIFGSAAFVPSQYRNADGGSIRVQRVFQELAPSDTWNVSDPFQYKVVSSNLGSVLMSPYGFRYNVRTIRGATVPLRANVDYTVYDWRIIRDEFRVPLTGYGSMKLTVNSIRPLSGSGPDGLPNRGLGGADGSLWTPNQDGVNGSQDFILQDVETGGIIVGNGSGANSAYVVDKSNSVITFRDVDGNSANGITAFVAFATGNSATPWVIDNANPIDLRGRALRALYMATAEVSVQVSKAATQYRVAVPGGPGSLQSAEAYAGGSNGWGAPNRIYFPRMDAGQRVIIGEIWTDNGPLLDQEFRISEGVETGGTELPFIELPSNLNFTENNYAVRRVRGSSVRVRVLWNPQNFQLGTDQVDNFRRLVTWAQSWRRIETESFLAGARN